MARRVWNVTWVTAAHEMQPPCQTFACVCVQGRETTSAAALVRSRRKQRLLLQMEPRSCHRFIAQQTLVWNAVTSAAVTIPPQVPRGHLHLPMPAVRPAQHHHHLHHPQQQEQQMPLPMFCGFRSRLRLWMSAATLYIFEIHGLATVWHSPSTTALGTREPLSCSPVAYMSCPPCLPATCKPQLGQRLVTRSGRMAVVMLRQLC